MTQASTGTPWRATLADGEFGEAAMLGAARQTLAIAARLGRPYPLTNGSRSTWTNHDR
jgi:hypothetical protein